MLTKRPLPKPPPQPDLLENKKKRIKLDILLRSDPSVQEELKKRCASDFVFWAEHFCWALDEQTIGESKRIPLVLYEFQKEMCLEMIAQVWKAVADPNYRWNGGADKARKMTATFSGLLVCQWFAQFHGVSTIVTSKSKETADVAGDMKTPMERLRWQVRQQWETTPWIFHADFNYDNKQQNKIGLMSFGTGGQISTVAPDGDGMRQGRALIWLGDEFAFVEKDYACWEAAAGTVRIRFIFSTPNNPLVKFYQLVNHAEGEQFHVFELDWWKHPDYAKGLYYKSDGTLSSPYMDNVVKTNSARVVAKEYLRDHENASGGRVFKMFRSEESCIPGLRPDAQVNTIYRSWDPGLTFAVTWNQIDRYGRLLLLHELVMDVEDIGVGETLLYKIAEKALRITELYYNEWDIVDIGDPYASRQQLSSQKKEETEYELLKKHFRIKVQSAFMYKISSHERREKRIELLGDAMREELELETGKVTPRLLINTENCPKTIEAFKGKYRRPTDERGQEIEGEIVEARPYTDVVDCHGMFAIKAFYTDSERNTEKTVATKRGRGKVWRPSGSRRRYA